MRQSRTTAESIPLTLPQSALPLPGRNDRKIAWIALSWPSLGLMALAGFCGGIAQLLLTSSYRYADVSTIAPFEYTSIVLGLIIGYVLFDDVPTGTMLTGTAIVVSAGIFVILREHRLDLKRRAEMRHKLLQG